MPQFIKGYEISWDKVAAIVKPFKVDAAIDVVIEQFLDCDGFMYIACGLRAGHEITRPLVIVLDEDYDEEKLKKRPLGELHSSVKWVKDVLDGPDVWERTA